jgi:hypothetical protein
MYAIYEEEDTYITLLIPGVALSKVGLAAVRTSARGSIFEKPVTE